MGRNVNQGEESATTVAVVQNFQAVSAVTTILERLDADKDLVTGTYSSLTLVSRDDGAGLSVEGLSQKVDKASTRIIGIVAA